MLLLSEIWIYPIKSLGGISLQKSDVQHRGLAYDRRWMLVDEQGVFLSQRTDPKLALFATAIIDSFLYVSHPDAANGSIEIALEQKFDAEAEVVGAKVWEDHVSSFEVSKKVSDWFSQIMNKKVRLVFMPDSSERKVDSRYAVSPNDINSFSDGFPFLLVGQSSLDDLNNRLKAPVSIKRFRPNFVFTGGLPAEEETWRRFTIGAVAFYGTNPCVRCVLVTVDPELGQLAGKEPLLTLSKYKRLGNSVTFGQNVIADHQGTIAVGDTVTVESYLGN
jgi:uncharacterized protein YcbX